MNSTVSTALLIMSAVVFSCVVVDYAVNIMQQTLNPVNNPQIDHIKSFENDLLNQTQIFNMTVPQLPMPTDPGS